MSLLERGMQRTDTPSEARSLRSYLTVGQLAAVLAAGIHAAVVPEHLQESLLIGGFFVVVAIGQFGLAAVLRRRPPLLVVVGAIWAHVALIALYVASRTVDLPFLPPTTTARAASSTSRWRVGTATASPPTRARGSSRWECRTWSVSAPSSC